MSVSAPSPSGMLSEGSSKGASSSPSPPTSPQRALRVPAIVFLLLLTGVTAWLGLNRLVTGDEGYYLLAAQLVASGKTPYHDFFFPQMPLVPYFYSLAAFLAAPCGPEWIWITGRLLSVGLSLLLGAALWHALLERTTAAWAIFGASVLTLSVNALPVFVTVQTYGLATALLFLAFVLADHSSLARSRTFAAGLCLGLSILARLPIAGIVPIFLLHVLLRARAALATTQTISRASSLPAICWAAAGIACGLFPALLLAAPDLGTFWFDNFGYHLVRENLSDQEVLGRRLKLLGALVGWRESGAFSGYQFPILLWLSIAGFFLKAFQRKGCSSSASMATLYALTLVTVHFTPSPPYMQYFSHAVPFLVFACVSFAFSFGTRTRLALLPLAICYFWPVLGNLATYTGDDMVRGMRRGVSPEEWKPLRFTRAAQAINAAVALDPAMPPTGISFWSGFFVGTLIRPIAGTENHFARGIASKMTPTRRHALGILSQRELYQALAESRAHYFLETPDPGRGIRQQSLQRGGFALLLPQAPTSLWRAPVRTDLSAEGFDRKANAP